MTSSTYRNLDDILSPAFHEACKRYIIEMYEESIKSDEEAWMKYATECGVIYLGSKKKCNNLGEM